MDPGIGTPGKLRRDAGFSLIELMVVVAIIATLSVGATLALGARGSAFERDLTRLQQAVATQRQQAIVGRVVQGLLITREGFQVALPGETRPQGKTVRWESGRLRLSPNEGRLATEGVFLPSGFQAPLAFSLAAASGQRADCASDPWGAFTCSRR